MRVEVLESFISTVTKQNALLKEFYEDCAIMYCSEAAEILCTYLSGLTMFDFTDISVVPRSEEVDEATEGGYARSLITLSSLCTGKLDGMYMLKQLS